MMSATGVKLSRIIVCPIVQRRFSPNDAKLNVSLCKISCVPNSQCFIYNIWSSLYLHSSKTLLSNLLYSKYQSSIPNYNFRKLISNNVNIYKDLFKYKELYNLSLKYFPLKKIKELRNTLERSRNYLYLYLPAMLQRSNNAKYSLFFAPSVLFNKDKTPGVFETNMVPIDIPLETKHDDVIKQKSWWKRLLMHIYEAIRVLLRALRLFFTFTPILLLYPITYSGKTGADIWWYLMLTAIELSGPIFIKLGQWISTRRDIFPDSCCYQFSRLQRRTQPHSWAFTKYRLKQAFGPHWRRVFVKFDNNQEPIGSGCVAQVYKVWVNADDIPDQTIIQEILCDLEEDEDDRILGIQDGLEVMGFGSWFGTNKQDELEQKEAVKNWYHRQFTNGMEGKETSTHYNIESKEVVNSQLTLYDLTRNIASRISPFVKVRPGHNNIDNLDVNNQCDPNEHALVEEWERKDCCLEKSLPCEDVPPDVLQGLVPVALKVLHPSIYSYFKRDVQIMRLCASLITVLYPPLRWLSLPQCVDEFGFVMSAQIDLRTEAKNLELFSENFADVSTVKFPKPLHPYVTSKVLLETFEEGVSMVDFIGETADEKPEELKTLLAQLGIDILLKMIFVDNLVHADLHPGNLLVQNVNLDVDPQSKRPLDGNNPKIMMVDVGCDTFVLDIQPDEKPVRLCVLDCGVVAKLSQDNLKKFRGVFEQIVLGDGQSVAEMFLSHSEHYCQDRDGFCREMAELVETARQETVSLNQVDVGMLLQRVMSVLGRHRVRLESSFSAVVLAVFVLEGLGRSLDKNMDILARARPILLTGSI